jgi:chromosome segregation protein
MKLDTLEMHGFKSFADRTEVKFNPGVTAIVGPNGCGKTNITDAIRWVLGEQRPTALRGASMQEVIFNGTRERKPLGMAEVSLSFSNALGLIPVEYAEVSVTRRVFRDEESHYFLNKAPCNLKDIRDLFMGTGVGASVYSVIEQRMVDAILSDRAEERRLLFEEAAGVTRYKARRKATERKLVATEEDLRRLSDILNEVRKNVNALRRQMGKARRFESLQREELRLAVALAQAELSDLEAREGPLRAAIAALETELGSGAAEAGAREAEVERLDRALSERRAEERALRERVEAAGAALEARERERMLSDEGHRHAALEVERLQREIAAHGEQARALTQKREGLATSLAAAREEAEAARRQASARGDVVAELTRLFEAAQEGLRGARSERERRVEERLGIEAELARTAAERQAATGRRAELEASLAALRAAAGGEDAAGPAGASLDARGEGAPSSLGLRGFGEPDRDAAVRGPAEEPALADRLERLRLERDAADAALRALAERRLAAEGAQAALEAELAELDSRRREVTARLDTLEEMADGFAGFGEGSRRALEARQAIAPGLRGPLGLEVEVSEARYAPAVEAYLDSFLDALLTRESGEARSVLEFWRERNQTGAVWSLGDAAHARHPQIDADASELVLCRGTQAASLRGELDDHREALFGRLLLAEDLDRATELRRRLNGNGGAGWYVVAALTGEILEPSGMIRLPHRKGESGGVSRFHQVEHLRSVLEEILRETRELEERATEARNASAAVLADEGVARARLEECAGEQDAAERELERVRGARRAALARAAEVAEELAAVGERLAREGGLADAAAAQAAGIRAALEAAEADCADRESGVEALRLEREAALAELGAAELAGQQRSAALAALERERDYLAEAVGEQERLARDAGAEVETQRERIARLEADSARLAAAVAEGRESLAAVRQSYRAMEESIQALEHERAGREAGARTARRAHEDANQRLHVEEMRLADLLHRRQSIHAIIETEFGHPLPELIGRAQAREVRAGADADELEDGADPSRTEEVHVDSPAAPEGESAEQRAERLEALRAALRGVREKKSSLGPVNLLALEEFTTEKERLDFLEAQYADLVKAREDLRQAIRKINTTARDLFLDTFGRAREHFQTTFGTLFEGGRADISLADEADPLESAIEIAASPRGKRIQAVNLLSGGERALTALALLFAIYLVKPSPFCILDEVDAPLDDANIGRFLRMIRSFSDRTQFVVVTHNKRTMEASDFLYGVTMQEPGVSTLVSVDFEKRHRFDYDAIAYRGGASAPAPDVWEPATPGPQGPASVPGGAGAGDVPTSGEPERFETADRRGALVGD